MVNMKKSYKETIFNPISQIQLKRFCNQFIYVLRRH